MPTRTKVPMSKPRSPALPRIALLALTFVSLTCSDDGGGVDGNGLISGTVFLAEPVEGAVVTVNRWDGGVVGAEVCRATTDAAGAYACQSGKYFGIMLVTATGGHTTEQGAALTLPASSVLRAPLLDLQPQQQRTIHLNPASELIVALGTARATAGQDADLVAAVTHAHALLRAHLDADPIAVAPKPVDAATAFDEPARVALVLRGLGEAAHTAAVDQAVTVQAVNTRALLDQLVKDATSAEARLDGNGLEVLSVGPSCLPPPGCTAEGPGCYASCSVHTSSLRGRLANAAITWLGTPANRTGLGPDDVLTWATALTTNTDAELFGPEPPEDNDTLGPVITWATPAAGQVFTTGTIMLDVTAADPLGVATLGVDHVVGQTRTPIADTDPTPERFVGSLPLTPALAEGTLTLEAHATDRDTNPSSDTREVSINQLTGGAISGVAIKAALASAPVTVRTFTNAAPGPILASGTTDPAGNFINLAIPEGTSGDLLLEVGGAGSYAEDAQPATVVSLAATEKLSVVLPAYVDGDTLAGLVVSPATTLAVAYTTYLQGANQGGADLAAKWATAVAALERHTGVTGLTAVVPSVPSQIDTLDDADRYGLLLLALSRTAWQASALGGGDAGAFGSAINAMKVLQVWVRDLGDGCWDGKAGPTALSYGGPTLLTDEATRLDLAQALVAYLASPQNQTQFAAPADVLPLLDTWATGGGNTGPGSCAGTNHTFDDAGASFDREGPVITWGTFPATDPFVRGMVTVTATAVDNLPTLPSLVFTTGQTDIDVAANAVRAVLDTTGLNGPVPLAVRATDGSTNATTAMHDLIADNLAPAITLTAPAMDGLFLRPPVTLGWTVVEANPMATTATLDTTTPVTPGFQVAAEGAHSVVVTATDRAGGSSTATRTFTIDSTAPALASVSAPSGTIVKPPLTITVTGTDNFMATGSLGADITVTSTPAPTTTTPGTMGGNRTLVVTYATLGDGSFTARFDLTDRAGNTTMHTVAKTIDGTAPTLAWSTTGLTGVGTDYWTATATPTLTGTVADANLATVIVSWPGGSAPAAVAGGAWTATLPATAGLGVGGRSVTVTATDLAGNPTAITRALRADVTPPVVGFGTTLVRQENKDVVTFDGTIDATYGVKKYNPTHAHQMTFTTTLGPATPCDASAPTVTKYAYLLDETPLYAIESGGIDAGGANALKWQVDPSDDGVGLTGARYRVVDNATSTTIINWTGMPTAPTLIKLFRNGTNGAVALGSAQGLLRIDVEATDALGRTTLMSRCWNQTLLAAPIVLDANDQAALPTNTAADIAANKWGLSTLLLESTATPAAPVSMMLTTVGATTAAGAGLFEFPIYNPTNEPVYVSVDLDLPAPTAMGSPLTTATWTRSSYDGRWVYREAVTNTSCGSVLEDAGPPVIYAPNYSLAGCENAPPAGNVPTLFTDMNQNVPAADFTVRAWTTNQTTTTLTELTQCAGCSTTPAATGRVRVTILVPPRGTTTTLPPTKVVLMPTLRPNSAYRPHGMTAIDAPTEFAVGTQRLTGQALATATQCVQWNAAPGPVPSGGFKCTRTRYYTKARYLEAVTVTNVGPRTVYVATGISGTTATAIPYLAGADFRSLFVPMGTVWSTAEPAPPAL
jgi:hypothetical protein